jgi:hypothetical protein
MSNTYWIIDETSYNVLGMFPTRGQAVDYVAALLSVNDDDFLDELTISNEAGPLLTGDSLRDALRHREAARKRAASSARGNGSNGSPTAAMAATSYRT